MRVRNGIGITPLKVFSDDTTKSHLLLYLWETQSAGRTKPIANAQQSWKLISASVSEIPNYTQDIEMYEMLVVFYTPNYVHIMQHAKNYF